MAARNSLKRRPDDFCHFVEAARSGAFLEAMGGRQKLGNGVVPERLRKGEADARREQARTLREYRQGLSGRKKGDLTKAKKAWQEARIGVAKAIGRIRLEAKVAGDVVYRGETIARVGALAAILGTGRVVLDGPAIERRERAHVRKAYLGG